MSTQLAHKVVYFPALPQQGQGLNGLFSFLGRLVGALIETAGKWIATLITTLQLDSLIAPSTVTGFTKKLADKAANVISSIGGGSGLIGTEPDITTAEFNWINFFYQNKLQPYVQKLLTELKAASQLADDAQYIAAINTILNKVNGINGHFDVEKDSLNYISEKARQQLQYFIYECLRPVFDGANAAAAEIPGATEYQVTFKMTAYNFMPLFGSSTLATVTCNNYKLGAATHTINLVPATTTPAATTPVATVPAVTPVKNPAVLTPTVLTPVGTVTPVKTPVTPVATPVKPASGTTAGPLIKTIGTETPATVTETENPASGDNKPNGKGLLIAAGIGLAAWFLFGRKKKSKKSK